jgi:hypothetical protein
MAFNRFAQEAWLHRREKIAARKEREAQSPALGIRIRTPYRDSAAKPASSIPADVAAHNSAVQRNGG